MDAVTNQEASLQTCHSKYHVFLSFRGEDTRKTFTDHLYTALIYAGIRTFRDDDELERGKNIELELRKAIQESKVSVIIFSKDYASSRWCLDELLQILERKVTVNHTILPIFYHVDPSEVRKQTGSFEKAFTRHEERFKAEKGGKKIEWMVKIERWKAALREVADLAGMVLNDGHESKFIQSVVKVIGSKLNRTVLSIPKFTIGMDTRIEDMNLWVQDGSTDIYVAMIYGMGGIGKTTIAKALYNLNFDRFDAGSFLANMKERSEEPNGLVGLQKQLLSDILQGRKVKVGCVDEGVMKIRDAICTKKVLVVLDDVDHVDQLNAVAILQDRLCPGSKIIITTRHEKLLKAHYSYKVHAVKELKDDESLQLFSWHAFGQDQPAGGYLEHSRSIVKYCGGLPLALEVLGSSLFGRSTDVWGSALKKLETIPETQIIKKLKISYDSLQDEHDQNLFLDIACFFVRKNKDFAITILDGCDFYTKVGIQNLVDRCLLAINEDNKLTMHQLLQYMGREIVRQESPREPGKRSRLWGHKDSFNVLQEKTGTHTIEGLALNLVKEDELAETGVSATNSKRIDTGNFLDEENALKRRRLGLFSWVPISPPLFKSNFTSNEVCLHTDAFSRMQKLRLLQLHNVRLTGGFGEFPKKLRWLSWRGFTLKSIPSDFSLESLIALDMRNSCLVQIWKGTKLLKVLKILNLSHSDRLTRTPVFSQLPNLERLILKHCKNLIEVHESIGELSGLVLLNLKHCKSLQKLPRTICLLTCLEQLIISGCSRLDELPAELGKMESLTLLHADGTAMNQKHLDSSEMNSWISLFWSKPRKTEKGSSFSLASLSHSLQTLSLANCNLSDNAIPEDLGCLPLLQHLNLSGNPIVTIPESIKGLTMLQSLGLDNCIKLQFLPELPISLAELELFKCRSLERVANLPNLLRSLDLTVNDCEKLVEVHGLFKLEPIGSTNAELINNLRRFNSEYNVNMEVEMFNCMTLTKRKVLPQGLYECGVFSTFLPRSEVPGWFFCKATGFLICVHVPSLPNRKIWGFYICVVYAVVNGNEHPECPRGNYWNEFYIKIFNKTKNLRWTYSPAFISIPGISEDMMWLSSWKIGNQFEAGDEVKISAFCWKSMHVKELGLHIVYDEPEMQGTPQNIILCPQNVGGRDYSEYQAAVGSFFLCHHDFDVHQGCAKKDNWISKGWYDFLFADTVEITGTAPVPPQFM